MTDWTHIRLSDKPKPVAVHLKLDPDVFTFFKKQGPKHLTRMQQVLKSYADHQKEAHARRYMD